MILELGILTCLTFTTEELKIHDDFLFLLILLFFHFIKRKSQILRILFTVTRKTRISTIFRYTKQICRLTVLVDV